MDKHLQRVVLRGVAEHFIGIEYLIEREFVSNEFVCRQFVLGNQLRSIASVFVLTRPIEISMFLIQSSFSASSTGFPCTPMFATCPPGRTISVAIVNVCGIPTASIATSTP